MNQIFRVALAIATIAAAAPALAQDNGRAEVSGAVKHDTLASLRSTVPQPDGYKRWHERDEHMLPLPYTPPEQADGALQASTRRAPLAPTLQGSVDGIGEGFTGPAGLFSVEYAPPDTVGSVGTTQYLQIVNTGLAVFDKATKTVLLGPLPSNTLWSGFGGPCQDDNDGDAVVVFDKAASRWVVSQFAVSGDPFFQCVAVSQTSDATGGWYRYAFSYASFPDYPKMGVWPDAYYETFNMFSGSNGPFAGSQLCAYDRSAMLNGDAATQQCFQLSTAFGGVLPADVDGPTAPPAGAPNYLVNFGSNALNLWKFHVDWTTPANTTLTGPASIAAAAFTPGCKGGSCIPQPGTQQNLDSLADRVMFRLAYRNFGDHESLLVNHTVTVGDKHNPYTGVRWYEIRSPGSTPAIFQQSTFSPDTDYRWMGSLAMDSQGNLVLGYSVSSSATFPAIRYAARLAGDPLSTLAAETSIFEGSGSQSGQNLDRWGDYSAMAIDPVDDCTFWYTNEYLKEDGAFNWSTRIGSIAFDACAAGKSDQSIAFTSIAPADAAFNGTYTVTATATSGLPVHLSIHAGSLGVCKLGGSASGSLVTFIGLGTCAIDADQGGNASFKAAAQTQQSFAVVAAAQAIAFDSTAPLAASFGGATYAVSASATSGLPVVLSIDSSAGTVCQIDGASNGARVSFVGVGSCVIDANQDGNTNYSAAPQKQQSFAVAAAPQSISFTSTARGDATYSGPTYTAKATATSGLPVMLSIDALAAGICALDGSVSGSKVSFIGVGSCLIDADQAGDTLHAAAPQAHQSFPVGQATQAIAFDSSAPANASVGGSAYQVFASATSSLAVVLSIDATATTICAIDGAASGANVTFLHAGTCTIDANQSGDSNYIAAPLKQQAFTVAPGPATQLVFTTQPATVTKGGTLATIAVTEEDAVGDVVDDDSSNVAFTVSDCGGNIDLGSSVMSHGVATLTSTQRFYTAASGLNVNAQTGTLSADSEPFAVQGDASFLFADGFDSCRL